MDFTLSDKYYFLNELLKYDIKNNDDLIKIVLISNKINDLIDQRINTVIFFNVKELIINLSACLHFEKVEEELIINKLELEKDINYLDVISLHKEYLNTIKEVIIKYNL